MPELSALAVVKFGGHAMDDPEISDSFFGDLADLRAMGLKFVLAHGGGPQINSLLERLGIESEFVNGLRVTDEKILEAAEMVLCGKTNKEIVRSLQLRGLSAAGISGEDGRLLIARIKNPALGRVGEVEKINPQIVNWLLAGDFMPVIAPLAQDETGNPLNVNADSAAGAIAGALRADYFVLVSDVPGVMDREKKVLAQLTETQIDSLIKDGVINGGMIPKVECCRRALRDGCKKALILDGRQKNSIRRFILNDEPLGTLIES